jgi:hypothetical protein
MAKSKQGEAVKNVVAEHTQTPFEIGWGDGVTGPTASPLAWWDNKGIEYDLIRKGKRVVAIVPAIDDAEQLANLEFLTLAANAHQSLVSALEAALYTLEGVWSVDMQQHDREEKFKALAEWRIDAARVLPEVVAALNLAKGGN